MSYTGTLSYPGSRVQNLIFLLDCLSTFAPEQNELSFYVCEVIITIIICKISRELSERKNIAVSVDLGA